MINHFIQFITDSPTSFHVALNAAHALSKHSFQELKLQESWKLHPGKKYFLRHEGSVIAFQIPLKTIEEGVILASHTDSPAFKLKPHAEFVKEDMTMLGLEVYGAPLLTSWLNRDLGIAGKIVYTDQKKQIKEAYVNVTKYPVVIPQIAIHLDRKVNEEGLLLNKQEHYYALASLAKKKKRSLLEEILSKEVPLTELLAHDLFLYPLEKPSLVGFQNELLAGYRFDSLASVFSILEAFTALQKPSAHTLKIMTLWDHEEIGSSTPFGAESPFFAHAFERIALGLGLSRENFLRLQHHTLSVSVDLGHATHPNYPEKHDPQHKTKLGAGVLIKTNAQKKYATDTTSSRKVIELARKNKIPYSFAVARNDIPSGSTVGPLHSTLTGISTVDIGIGQLSMHSARELIAIEDLKSLASFLKLITKK